MVILLCLPAVTLLLIQWLGARPFCSPAVIHCSLLASAFSALLVLPRVGGHDVITPIPLNLRGLFHPVADFVLIRSISLPVPFLVNSSTLCSTTPCVLSFSLYLDFSVFLHALLCSHFTLTCRPHTDPFSVSSDTLSCVLSTDMLIFGDSIVFLTLGAF